MSELRDRLLLLGVLPPPGQPSPESAEPLPPLGPGDREARAEALAAALPGAVARRAGEGWLVERELPLLAVDEALGRCGERLVGSALARLAGDPGAEGLRLGAAAALDVETTGLGFGAGTYAFLVGLLHLGGASDGRGARLWQGLMADPVEEPALLGRVREALGDTPLLLTYNGRSFDLPLLGARAALHRLDPGLGGRRHLDLLGPARQLFRPRLGGCALGRIQAFVLGQPRGEDVPGAAIPDLYRAFLRLGAPAVAPLAQVAQHNALDLEAVVHLALRLAGALGAGDPEGLCFGADWLGLGRCRRRLGDPEGGEQAFSEAWRRLGEEAAGEEGDSNPPMEAQEGPVQYVQGLGRGGLPEDHPALLRLLGQHGREPRQRQLTLDPRPGTGTGTESKGGDAPEPEGLPQARARHLRALAGLAGLEVGRQRRRAGDLAGARSVFELLREAGLAGVAPHVELAKMAEHRERDLAGALAIVDEALEGLVSGALGLEERHAEALHELRHRRDRLRRRLGLA